MITIFSFDIPLFTIPSAMETIPFDIEANTLILTGDDASISSKVLQITFLKALIVSSCDALIFSLKQAVDLHYQ